MNKTLKRRSIRSRSKQSKLRKSPTGRRPSKRPSRKLSKRPTGRRPSKRPIGRSRKLRSRFGKTAEEIAKIAKSMNMTPAQYLYQRERDFHNHLLTPTPPTKLERALDLSRNSGQKYSSNPERSTYTVSRNEFENTIQDLQNSMTRLQSDTTEHIENLQNKLRRTKKEAMLKSIYSVVTIDGNIIYSGIYGSSTSKILMSPKYFYLTDNIYIPNSSSYTILEKFPNIKSVIFAGTINFSAIDFRGLEKLESLTFHSPITFPIDLSPLINLKVINISSIKVPIDLSSLINLKSIEIASITDLVLLREGIRNLNKLQQISIQSVSLTQTQLTEYGIRYDNSRQSEYDILKDYIYDDEDYEDEFTRISVGRRDGAGLPS